MRWRWAAPFGISSNHISTALLPLELTSVVLERDALALWGVPERGRAGSMCFGGRSRRSCRPASAAPPVGQNNGLTALFHKSTLPNARPCHQSEGGKFLPCHVARTPPTPVPRTAEIVMVAGSNTSAPVSEPSLTVAAFADRLSASDAAPTPTILLKRTRGAMALGAEACARTATTGAAGRAVAAIFKQVAIVLCGGQVCEGEERGRVIGMAGPPQRRSNSI